jgi:hypothetical protein
MSWSVFYFHPCLIFVGKAGTYLTGAPLVTRLLEQVYLPSIGLQTKYQMPVDEMTKPQRELKSWLVTANSAFYHSLSDFVLLTEYFETREKLKVALMTFEVSKTEPQKQITFLNWPIINEFS